MHTLASNILVGCQYLCAVNNQSNIRKIFSVNITMIFSLASAKHPEQTP